VIRKYSKHTKPSNLTLGKIVKRKEKKLCGDAVFVV
jgi:hypothetical protein